jgi:hypothetical protein
LSGPSGRPASPQSTWSVVVGVGENDVMLSSSETVLIVPLDDVVKIADYDPRHAISLIKKIRNLKSISKK